MIRKYSTIKEFKRCCKRCGNRFSYFLSIVFAIMLILFLVGFLHFVIWTFTQIGNKIFDNNVTYFTNNFMGFWGAAVSVFGLYFTVYILLITKEEKHLDISFREVVLSSVNAFADVSLIFSMMTVVNIIMASVFCFSGDIRQCFSYSFSSMICCVIYLVVNVIFFRLGTEKQWLRYLKNYFFGFQIIERKRFNYNFIFTKDVDALIKKKNITIRFILRIQILKDTIYERNDLNGDMNLICKCLEWQSNHVNNDLSFIYFFMAMLKIIELVKVLKEDNKEYYCKKVIASINVAFTQFLTSKYYKRIKDIPDYMLVSEIEEMKKCGLKFCDLSKQLCIFKAFVNKDIFNFLDDYKNLYVNVLNETFKFDKEYDLFKESVANPSCTFRLLSAEFNCLKN